MELPFGIPPALILFLMVLGWLYYSLRQRDRAQKEEEPRKQPWARRRRMDFSAGRDAAHKGARFQQTFIPMEPDEEAALRGFYLDLLGLTEMRAPNYPKDRDGFWAVSGTRQIYFGTQPSFAFDTRGLPSFPIPDIEAVAEKLATEGYAVKWDRGTAYVLRLIVTDPAGTEIALIAG